MIRFRSYALLSALLLFAGGARAADGYGKLTGVVSDLSGNPQMGAAIWLDAEAPGNHAALRLLTDQNGTFAGPRLRPGLYSVKATLAGFLPTIRQHVSVGADATTLVRIELDSVFTSLDTLRRPTSQRSESDDWRWVLRTSSATRPVLQLRDGEVIVADDARSNADARKVEPHARLELTSGSSEPGSSSARSGSLATTAAYDQSLGGAGKLLLVGRLQYPWLFGDSFGGSVASVWVPSGHFGEGPETTIVLRQMRVGPQETTGIIRTMRVEHTERIALTDRMAAEYGAEYVMGGVGGSTSTAIRPHARVTTQLSPTWSVAVSLQTNPDAEGLWVHGPGLESAMGALDTLPVLVWNSNGRATYEGGWHEEFAVRHKLGTKASLEVAGFHDFSSHQAVFGFNPSSPSPVGSFSTPWAHDGGAAGSWGMRVVYRQRISEGLDLSAIYTWAGALTPTQGSPSDVALSEMLHTGYRHSVAGRVAEKVPKTQTELAASYKWLQGTVVSRQDLYGEAALGVDPNLSLTVRQPLPSFLGGAHWEALVDFRNVLAQGYVPVESQGGRMILMPVERSFRGGVSVQF